MKLTLLTDVEKKNGYVNDKYFKKRWLSGLKRQIVNLLRFLIAGSNPALFKTNKNVNVVFFTYLFRFRTQSVKVEA